MTKTLEDKLATMVHHMAELRAGRHETRQRILDSMLDDVEVAEWLDQKSKQNCVDFTRFS